MLGSWLVSGWLSYLPTTETAMGFCLNGAFISEDDIVEVLAKVLPCKDELLLFVHSSYKLAMQYELPRNVHPSETLQRRTV